MLFAGIDLTTSPKRPSAWALLDAGSRALQLGHFGPDEELMDMLEKYGLCLVAVDAPLSLPLGLCCHEDTCPCKQTLEEKGRICERELARMGIGCFFTTKGSIIKAMVYRGIALRHKLLSHGHQVLETYPYASKVRLFGKPIPRKNTEEGRAFLERRLFALVPSVGEHMQRLDHNILDALLAAYTGYLFHSGEADVLGEPREGLIVIPRKRAAQ